MTIMGSGEPWKLVDRLKGFNWLNYDGGKFSTSQKRGMFMDTALEIVPADYWRYYLIANAPEGSDRNFTWEHFAGVINKDLADVLGNFVNRVTKFCVARFDGKVPGEGEYGEEEKALIAELDARIAQYTELHGGDANSARRWPNCAPSGWRAMNISPRAAPWTAIKTDRAKAAVGVRMGLNLVHLFAHLVWPVMPTSARAIHEAIQPIAAGDLIPWPDEPMAEFLDELEPGSRSRAPEVLFAKITDEQVAEWKARFGGAETHEHVRQAAHAGRCRRAARTPAGVAASAVRQPSRPIRSQEDAMTKEAMAGTAGNSRFLRRLRRRRAERHGRVLHDRRDRSSRTPAMSARCMCATRRAAPGLRDALMTALIDHAADVWSSRSSSP